MVKCYLPSLVVMVRGNCFSLSYCISQRLDVLLKQEKYKEALVLAQSFYEGRAKAVVGLPGSAHKRKQVVADKVRVWAGTLQYFSALSRLITMHHA